jgi:DNA-directed RNA polymerase
VGIVDDIFVQDKAVMKMKGSYYKEKTAYIQCLFNLKLLPIKMHLPMICPPLPWSIKQSSKHKYDKKKNIMVSFSDMNGGYLTHSSAQIMTRYLLLTSHQYEHFNIKFKNKESCQSYCRIISKLQETPFRVNKEMLNFIREHRESLEEKGILMPSFLSNLNLHVVYERLRVAVSTAKRIDFVFSELASHLDKLVQRARYEDFTINLATALEEYTFRFPAFIDFRGRIYRTGYLNFHERDLARSLLLFSSSEDKGQGISKKCISTSSDLSNETYRSLVCAAYAHYQTPTSVTSSYQWLNQHGFTSEEPSSAVSPATIIDLASKSLNPFLFIANVIRLKRLHIGDSKKTIGSIPISMDASSSAYQILSYFLLDEDLAERTNLIGGDGDTIKDLYASLIEPLSSYLEEKLTTPLNSVVPTRITRKLIKQVYMPMVYGKSVMSASKDIYSSMLDILKKKEAYEVAKAFHAFWAKKYPQILNLMNLINLGGWFAATLNHPVVYHTQYFQSIQDYMMTEPVNVWVFDRKKMTRRKITLSMPTTNRDRNKTQRACFANFIHQKDASIALFIIDNFNHKNLYTVHDNFIVNPSQANNINHWYASAFQSLGDPLSQVNHYLFYNIIVHSKLFTELSSQEIQSFIRTLTEMDTPHTNLTCAESLQHLLEQALNDLKPVGLKKVIDAWKKKQKMLLDSYESYVSTLGFQGGQSVDYDNKYHSFLEKLHHKDTSFALHP